MNEMNNADSIVSTAQAGLRLDPPPTEAEIAEFLGRLKVAFNIDEQIIENARIALHARFNHRMELGQTIRDDDSHEPWLSARKAEIEPFYWERYRKFLLRGGWGPHVVSTLDQSLDEILDLLRDPSKPAPWKRRGLVVGDVQSGKTATYAGLINKASDAGYRMIILLTGTLENVRKQTQERLDAAFVGFDSRDYLSTSQLQRKKHVGVGLIDGRRDGVVFTSRDKDFRRDTATALNISLDSVRDPVLVVSKKNKAILERVAAWLRARNADRDGKIDLPLLLIDDEADNASINTRSNPEETTAINRAIRDLCSLFKRSSYVGFTATPFANIFIDPDSTDQWLEDDLFPKDFIHLLEAPNNYIGMNRIFPARDADDGSLDTADDDDPDMLVQIDDELDWLPSDHKSHAMPGPLPDSLKEAMDWFLLTCAIRDLRAQSDAPGKGGGLHRSMLVNVSRFTRIQDEVAGDLQQELERMQRSIRLHGAKEPSRAATESADISRLEEVFGKFGETCEFAWGDVLANLHQAVAPVRVQPINQRTGSAALDYGAVKTEPGVRVIAVGGNSLSRGITLEGLCVSYFLRNSKAYDTLLQMGRWFGYRDGYGDLCRIWLNPEAEGWYRHITLATSELKRDFRRMRIQRATPREFGLRVRTHPDTLIITARNKMATGMDVVSEVQEVSLTGRGIETARVHKRSDYSDENRRLVERFLADLSSSAEPELVRKDGAYLWRNVDSATIAEFVEPFLVHPLNHDFQGDSIAEHLREAASDPEHPWRTWNVALPRKGEKRGDPWVMEEPVRLEADPKLRRVVIKNETTPPSLLLSGSSARVGSRTEVLYGMSPEEEAEALNRAQEETPSARAIPEDVARSVMQRPLLVIYLVRGYVKHPNSDEKPLFEDGRIIPALGLHFPGEKDPNAKKRLVKYRLNRIAQAELDMGLDLADDRPIDEDYDA